MMVTFVVQGPPVPKGRPRVTRNGTFTPQDTLDYEQKVGWSYRAQAGGPPGVDGESRFGLMMNINGSLADVDNVVKSVMDGLQRVVYENDSQVDQLTVNRVRAARGDRGVTVTIWTIVE